MIANILELNKGKNKKNNFNNKNDQIINKMAMNILQKVKQAKKTKANTLKNEEKIQKFDQFYLQLQQCKKQLRQQKKQKEKLSKQINFLKYRNQRQGKQTNTNENKQQSKTSQKTHKLIEKNKLLQETLKTLVSTHTQFKVAKVDPKINNQKNKLKQLSSQNSNQLLNHIEVLKKKLIQSDKQKLQLRNEIINLNEKKQVKQINSLGKQKKKLTKIFESICKKQNQEIVKIKNQQINNINSQKQRLQQTIRANRLSNNITLEKLQKQYQSLQKQNKRLLQELETKKYHVILQQKNSRIQALEKEVIQLQKKIQTLLNSNYYKENKKIFQLQSKNIELEKHFRNQQQTILRLNKIIDNVKLERDFFIKENKKLQKKIKPQSNYNVLNIQQNNKLQQKKQLQKLKFMKSAQWKQIYQVKNTQSMSQQMQIKVLKNQKQSLLSYLQQKDKETQSLIQQLQKLKDQLNNEKYNHKEQYYKLQKKKQQLESILYLKKQEKKPQYQYGIFYSDNIKQFKSINHKQLRKNQNFIDVYLGQFKISKNLISNFTQLNPLNLKQLLCFANVTFYNSQTHHTQIKQGVNINFQFVRQFKILYDSNFINFLKNPQIQIQVWINYQNYQQQVGKGKIRLNRLIEESKLQNISIVQSSFQAIFNQNRQLMGVIQYKIRSRVPLYQVIQQYKITDNQIQQKFLKIQIKNGQGFKTQQKICAYLEIENNYLYTQAVKGQNPIWNFSEKITITNQKQFKQKLQNNLYNIYVLNDNEQINDQKLEIFGKSRICFKELASQEHKIYNIEIKNENEEILGKIKIKLIWEIK